MNAKELKREEDELRRMAARSTYFPTTYAAHADAYRNARRYLALREHGILLRQEGVVFDVVNLDATADRFLEGE